MSSTLTAGDRMRMAGATKRGSRHGMGMNSGDPSTDRVQWIDDSPTPAGKRGLLALVSAWALVVVGGFAALEYYANDPGTAARAPVRWPEQATLPRQADRATLVMFAHPRCPCTRASVAELARLVARGRDRLTAHVVFVKPDGSPAEWARTALWRKAAAIPGVAVHADHGGRTSRQFGAVTSGQTVLYDRTGALVFDGGLTASRGHEGDSVGQSMILALLRGERTEQGSSSVFGCGLFTPCARESGPGGCRNEACCGK